MKFYVIKTTKNGIEYKKYKCIDGWTKEKTASWQFSKQGAERIAKFITMCQLLKMIWITFE